MTKQTPIKADNWPTEAPRMRAKLRHAIHLIVSDSKSVKDAAAGEFIQWHNQDDGFGLCARCADWIIERDQRKPPDWRTDMSRTYGIPGINREAGPKFEGA